MNLETLRRRLANEQGQAFWRSLDELAGTDEFETFLHQEFPGLEGAWERRVDRRGFLRISAAALAMAGAAGCTRQPPEDILPYVRMPEYMVLGESRFYATTSGAAGPGLGVLVETREGRPLRVEGNPEHPASLGAVDVFSQASVLSLYDPDRSQSLMHLNRATTWGTFQSAWARHRQRLDGSGGRGFAMLTPRLYSPTELSAIESLLRRFPRARWYTHDPLVRPGVGPGGEMVFGRPLVPIPHLDSCRRLFSLDADFLFGEPGSLRAARGYAAARAVREGRRDGSRLYAVESQTTLTGAKADHHQAVKPSQVEAVARHLARRLGLDVQAPRELPLPARWLDAAAADLQAHRGSSLILAGEAQGATVHALTHLMNHQLDAVGRTVTYVEPPLVQPSADLADLSRAILHDEVDTLVIFGGNPVYSAPGDVPFLDALQRVPTSVHWGDYHNETARHCTWHVPATHELETWSDRVAFDGTASPVQPVVRPLYNGIQPLAFLASLQQRGVHEPPREQLRRFWRERLRARDDSLGFEDYWKRSLHDGVFAGTAPASVAAVPVSEWRSRLPPPRDPHDALEVRLAADPAIRDGDFANNAWLQELPKPLSKIVWGNALLINPATAADLAIARHEVVEVRRGERVVRAPAFWHPGQPRQAVSLHLGYGREHAGHVGSGVGSNAYPLRTTEGPWFGPVTLQGTGVMLDVITTQHHHSMEGREHEIAQEVTLEEVHRQEPVVKDATPEHSLYPEWEYDGYAWGMAVDINACIGCNSCVIACQAENNIPTVGPQEVQRGHEMHWLRIDRYYKGPAAHPDTLFQPVPCMHCEKAPCEYVCPVHATTHSSEGINQMTYNRCIGTRFCSQNCPYKVRRFNFFDFTGDHATTPAAVGTYNPEVTVRSRGVMEKCTYCIQRINRARIESQKRGRRIRDGEVRTACQEACPTEAIVFGDINDPDAHVTRLKQTELNYAMLAKLNTRPRTTYLAGIRHPNPDIPTDDSHG